MKFLTKESQGYGPQSDDASVPARSSSQEESWSNLSALLGRGCEYEGKLTFEGTVRIDGKFTGEVFSNDVLIIGEGAEIHAEIDVAVVVVSGNVKGNITARNRLELHAPGRLTGNIVTSTLSIEEGAVFEGNCKMDVGEYQKAGNGDPKATVSPASESSDMDTFDLSRYESSS